MSDELPAGDEEQQPVTDPESQACDDDEDLNDA